MSTAQGFRQAGYFDCAGGGAPLASVEIPKGMHSHKVRAAVILTE